MVVAVVLASTAVALSAGLVVAAGLLALAGRWLVVVTVEGQSMAPTYDTGDRVRLAAHAEATFWYVLPSLPMFLLIPALLRHGVGFWVSLAAGCVLTILLYLAVVAIAARFGVTL